MLEKMLCWKSGLRELKSFQIGADSASILLLTSRGRAAEQRRKISTISRSASVMPRAEGRHCFFASAPSLLPSFA